MSCLTAVRSSLIGFYPFENQQDQWGQMKAQVKDIHRPVEHSIFEHEDFFHNVRHGFDRRCQHHDGQYDQYGIRDFIKQVLHGPSLS